MKDEGIYTIVYLTSTTCAIPKVAFPTTFIFIWHIYIITAEAVINVATAETRTRLKTTIDATQPASLDGHSTASIDWLFRWLGVLADSGSPIVALYK